MATTPQFFWPYQSLTDPPNGAVLGGSLALAIEATLSSIPASVASHETRLTTIEAGWPSWVPTLTNLTLGNGVQVASYRQAGKTFDWYWRFVLGTTSAVGTDPHFTLPATPAGSYGSLTFPLQGLGFDISAFALRELMNTSLTGADIRLGYWNAGVPATISATAPWTWTTGDELAAWGTFQGA